MIQIGDLDNSGGDGVYHLWYLPLWTNPEEDRCGVLSDVGRREPVRDWLKGLSPEDRREIGQDIATVEYGWPVGMPVCRPLGQGLWEVRSTLSGNRIARVIFCIAQGRMVLVHGFMKKTQKIPNEDLALARRRMKEIEQ